MLEVFIEHRTIERTLLRITISVAVFLSICDALPAQAAATPAAVAAEQTLPWVTAHALYGDPKYPADFDHFEYADPNAPKGGTLTLGNPDRRTSFDKFNPWTVKGDAPAGVSLFMFETLAVGSADEPETLYGLIGQSYQIAPDLSFVTIKIDPRAQLL